MQYRAWMLAIAMGAAAPAQALVTACVDTVEEFDAAYQQAQEDDVEIRIVRGSYNMSSSCIGFNDNQFRCQFIDEAITLRGGYAPGCGSRTLDATDTVLIGSGSGAGGPGFRMDTRDPIVLDTLTFSQYDGGFTFKVESSISPDARLTLRRVWFDRMGPLRLEGGAELVISNSMFTRSRGGGSSCAIEAGITAGSLLELVSLTHVTIADGSGNGLCVGQTASNEPGDIRVRLFNSIAWGNSGGTDIRLRQLGVIDGILNANTYGSLSVVPSLSQSPSATMTSDPQFVAPSGNDFELGGSSTSINSAAILANTLTEVDLKGDARQFSTAPDRGALESAVGSTATTITVTSSANSGAGTLRQAILDANQTPELTRIHFNIPGSCPRVITLSSGALPELGSNIRIDGYTQPGASRNTLSAANNAVICIVLHNGGPALAGLIVPQTIAADRAVSIDGIGFSNFPLGGVNFNGGANHALRGSQVGGNISGYSATASGYGVRLAAATRDIAIGGEEPADRNTFADASLVGVQVLGREALILNNYVGTHPLGSSVLPNGIGIELRGGGNHQVIGNLVSGNLGAGIEIENAEFNVISSNTIGTSAICAFGNCDLGNGSHGVLIFGSAARGNSVSENRILYNGGDGIAINEGAAGNVITANSMRDNIGLGIDLGANGLTANDNDYATPPANAGNANQNAPQLSVASGGVASGTVSGTLSTRNGTYRINFYADDSCPPPIANDTGQGRYPLTQTVVTVTGGDPANGINGTGSFSNIPLSRAGDPQFFNSPRLILATATRTSSNDSSEFSRCVSYEVRLFANGFE